MNTLFGFLLLACLSATSFSTPFSNPAWIEIREQYAFEHQTKWDCFYRTTTPVSNMDPSIWRHDQYGNLLMAGLNFNCKGCLCYTFDHRYPISYIGSVKPTDRLKSLVSSIHNCQALSFRTNALKGGNDDKDVKNYIGRFGCDFDTMKLLEDNSYLGASAVQKYLIGPDRLKEIHHYYTKYVNGLNFFDPKEVNQSKAEYFAKLNSNAEAVAKKIENEIEAINNKTNI